MYWIRCRFSGVVAVFLDKVLVLRIRCGVLISGCRCSG